ncbi:hypothetical protein Droror1_Dr00010834 [Drosera rotundifolia]
MSSSTMASTSLRTQLSTVCVANKFTALSGSNQQTRSRLKMGRRSLGMKGCVAVGVSGLGSSVAAQPVQGLERLAFKPDGYNFWKWKGHNIHYLVQGEGPAIVLIHGFGASVFHWRYNIPELSKRYKVYALDLLGFGWSEKAILDYDAMVWRDQVVDFLKEVVKEPTILVGNSLGGFTALASASELVDQVVGVVLLNSAGRFRDASDEVAQSEESLVQKYIVKPVKEIIQRFVIGLLFWQAKQPGRIQSVLNSVYIDKTNVDDYLIQSITVPANHPSAGEVYYRLMAQLGVNLQKYTLNAVIDKLSCPILLLWGDSDPWTGSDKALRIKEYYPNASLTFLKAGHCPHDEVPELVNKALLEWLCGLNLNTSYQNM